MSEKRLEIKVGVFVLAGLVLLGGLMLYFSKSQSLFAADYAINMRIGNIGGLKPKAEVLLSGVSVGSVEGISLSEDGKEATVRLRMLKRYKIYSDAHFVIDQMGFLGDPYISVRPGDNAGPPLTEGATVTGEEPFSMTDLFNNTKKSLTDVNVVVDRVQKVLNETNINNISAAIDGVVATLESVTNLMESVNRGQGVVGKLFKDQKMEQDMVMIAGNLKEMSGKLNSNGLWSVLWDQKREAEAGKMMADLGAMAAHLNILSSNMNEHGMWSVLWDDAREREMAEVVSNLHTLSGNLAALSESLNTNGLWSVLWDENTKPHADEMMTNLNATAAHLRILSSNINSRGLWSVLRKPRETGDAKSPAAKPAFDFSGKRDH